MANKIYTCVISGNSVRVLNEYGQIQFSIFPPKRPTQATISGDICTILYETDRSGGAKGGMYNCANGGQIMRSLF